MAIDIYFALSYIFLLALEGVNVVILSVDDFTGQAQMSGQKSNHIAMRLNSWNHLCTTYRVSSNHIIILLNHRVTTERTS